MKRIFASFILMVVSLAMMAYDFSVDGICYKVVSSTKLTVEVTYRTEEYKSYAGEITLPETVQWNNQTYTVERIGKNAFKKCVNLEAITLPDGLCTIGADAFFGCTSLRTVIIPDSVKTIAMGSFASCSKLAVVRFGSQLERVNMYAFSECTSLETVSLPATVVYVGEYAFGDCSSLKSASIPSSAEVESNSFKDTSAKITTF